MKELLKQAFQAGIDFGHAIGTGRPTYGLSFDEWYSENENQALSLGDVVGRSEQLLFSPDDIERIVNEKSMFNGKQFRKMF